MRSLFTIGVLAAAAATATADTVTLPVAASVVGAAPFVSDVRVFNTSYTSPVTVTATYRCAPGSSAACATQPVRSFQLAAREARAFDDICVSLFGVPNSLGAVEFDTPAGGIVVTSRLYSPAASPPWPAGTVGSVGMFIPPLTAADAKPVTVLTNLANGGSSNGAYRTNVGVYNPNTGTVVATIRLYESGSVLLGSTAVTLNGKTGAQISNIYQSVGFGSIATNNGYATVESDNGSPLFTYAATADNATQDPVLVVGSGDLAAPAGFHASTPTPAGGGGTPNPTPTRTPTAPAGGAPQRIEIDVARYAFTPGSASPIQVTVGVVTTLHFTSSDGTHGFSGIPDLGIAGFNTISAGSYDPYGGGGNPQDYTVTFTPGAASRGQTFPFKCSASPECGTGHSTMLGTLHVN
jgi:hypothetical protein